MRGEKGKREVRSEKRETSGKVKISGLSAYSIFRDKKTRIQALFGWHVSEFYF